MNILLTYIGGRAGRSVIDCLLKSSFRDRIRIIGCDSEEVSSKNLVDKFYKVPLSTSKDFDKVLNSIILKENINLYLPTGEEDLIFFSKLKFKYPFIKFIISNPTDVERCLNKWLFYNYNKLDSRMIWTSMIVEDQGIIKPILGRGSKGFKEVKDTFVLPEGYIWQPKIYGDELTVDILTINDNFNCSIRKRTKVEKGISTQADIVNMPEIENVCKNLVKVYNLEGPLCIQFKGDKILEINPRFAGGIDFTCNAGINHPEMILESILDNNYSSFNKKPTLGHYER